MSATIRLACAMALAFSCSLLAVGCEPKDDDFFGDAGQQCTDEPQDPTGRWILAGTAIRSDCSDESLNADNVTLSSDELEFELKGNVLEFKGPSQSGDATNRTVLGTWSTCIANVKIIEKFREGQIELRLKGVVFGNVIDGSLTGTGPGSCQLKGTFTAQIVDATP